jgi:hypothetical protein
LSSRCHQWGRAAESPDGKGNTASPKVISRHHFLDRQVGMLASPPKLAQAPLRALTGMARSVFPFSARWRLSRDYTTGLPLTSARIRRRNEVDRTIRETTLRFSAVAVPSDPGTVRFRKTIGVAGPWNVETFGQANSL